MNANIQSPNATIFFIKKNNLHDEQIGDFLEYTKLFLTSKGDLKDDLNHELLKNIYKFRMLLIEWMKKDYTYSIENLLNETNEKFDSYKDENLKEINESVRFSIFCISKIVLALIDSNFLNKDELKIENISTHEKNYDEIINIILDNTPSVSAAINIKFMNCNLLLDFLILCSVVINEKMVNVSRKKIEEISFFLMDISENYMRYAYELGILNFNEKTINTLEEAKFFMNSKI